MRLLMNRATSDLPPLRFRLPRVPSRALALAACALIAVGVAGTGTWLWRDGAVARAEAEIAHRFFGLGAEQGLALAKVEVEGRYYQNKDAILAALGVKRGMAVLDIDLAAAKARLEQLPWVRAAAIERRLPDTLYIRLTERQPFAFWQSNGQLALIDRDGTVITRDALFRYGPLLVLVGDDAPAQAADLLALLQTEPALAKRVKSATRYGGRRWNLRFANGIDVALPETGAEDAWHRLAALERSEQVLERQIAAIDLRLPDRIVVRTAPAPDAKKPPALKQSATVKDKNA